MKQIFLVLFFALFQGVYCQDTTFLFKPATEIDSLKSGVVYDEDERTDELLKELQQYEIQGDFVVINGFRIQIYFSNERKLADEQRLKFLRLYPEYEAFLEYDTPNYTVKVGAFKTRAEAEEFRSIITSVFPMSIIQRHKIKMPLKRNDSGEIEIEEGE